MLLLSQVSHALRTWRFAGVVLALTVLVLFSLVVQALLTYHAHTEEVYTKMLSDLIQENQALKKEIAETHRLETQHRLNQEQFHRRSETELLLRERKVMEELAACLRSKPDLPA
mmetsp:Transcript_11675/g.29490  ORF Transcript_11675/g.29490 Transcript_11675/m.29490 type:complete len:114 (+) Transcript_11675:152-493(+)